ncbi:P-loop containing nucleoside triphosphate hydrolase protein [Rhizodiscina lignyota]|uniref:P-loop containing nucleoside triphosphate hydrolase protein n=1 Tax=Rhizodiscina lignyota TaxID=1504668 RepID=A0A9P4I9N2_9PEZI|nr:P-loop containing nucleoside triphosphate hydrolase protein [Rhizodiscina lignyota]
MALLPWVCSRCTRRLLRERKFPSRSFNERSKDAAIKSRARSYATACPERSQNIDWEDWFDSAAPYIPSVSGAAFNDRQRRSHHGREWIPPLRLQSSFAPQLEVFQRAPMEMTPKKKRVKSGITMAPPAQVVRLRDEQWVREELEYPTKDDYPEAPDALFDPPSFEALLDAFKEVRPGDLVQRGESRLIRPTVNAHPFWRRVLSARLRDKDWFSVVGEGYTRDEAALAAQMNLIAVLHSQDCLFNAEDLGDLDGFEEKLDLEESTWATIIQVYNYAARYGAIPQYSWQTKSVGDLSFGQVTITINLPSGRTITASATGLSRATMELKACVQLKIAAEKFQVSDERGGLDLRDHEAVNIDNASAFLNAYRMMDPASTITFEKSLHFHHSRPVWQLQAVLDGKALGPPVLYHWLNRGESLVRLVAAVELVKQHPELMDIFKKARDRTQGFALPRTVPIETPGIANVSAVIRRATESVQRTRMADHQVLPDSTGEVPSATRDNFMARYRSARARQYSHQHRMSEHTRSQNLRLSQEYYWINPAIVNMRNERLSLPVNQHRQRILDLIRDHSISIVIGSTGSGKSTQIPQIVLEEAIRGMRGSKCNIVCTQPRRIAAKNLAHRVASERDEVLGEVVGYQVGGGDRVTSELGGSITYSTPEIQTLLLENFPDEVLEGTSHFIIDEVHQRDAATDQLLAMLKRTTEERRDQGKSMPKIILMSATVQSKLFEQYFKIDGMESPPTISVPGRSFPITEFYLEDIIGQLQKNSPAKAVQNILVGQFGSSSYVTQELEFSLQQRNKRREEEEEQDEDADGHPANPETLPVQWSSRFELEDSLQHTPFGLVVSTITHILESTVSGDILVFLPGIATIQTVKEILEEHSLFQDNDSTKHRIIILHAMNRAGIDEAAMPPRTAGERKILLSTDVAETSLTLKDVDFVVDSGLCRTFFTDPLYGVKLFENSWISQASATQRAGRTGRVRPGNYYALFSRERRTSFIPTSRHQDHGPVDLMKRVLRVRKYAPVQDYFRDTIDPPPPESVDNALARLRDIGAMTALDDLTRLGHVLCNSVVSPQHSMQVYMGAVFGCLEPMLIITAAEEMDSLFVHPKDEHSRRRAKAVRKFYAQGTRSDHIVMLNAYREIRKYRDERGEEWAREWAANNFIDYKRFENIDRQFRSLRSLVLNTVAPNQSNAHVIFNSRSDDNTLIQALLVAGNYAGIATHEHDNFFMTPIGIKAQASYMSLASISYHETREESGSSSTLKDTVAVYSRWHRLNNKNSLIGNISPVSPLALLLFGGNIERKPDSDDILVMDDWLSIRVPGEGAAEAALELRTAWNRVWWSAVREFARGKSGTAGSRDARLRQTFVQRVVDLLHTESGGFGIRPINASPISDERTQVAESQGAETPTSDDALQAEDAHETDLKSLKCILPQAQVQMHDSGTDRDFINEWGALPHEA